MLIQPSTISNRATNTENGNSPVRVERLTVSGQNSAHIPHTTIRLKILEPTALPTATPVLPDNAALMLTAHSGRLVPIATIVSPIIMDGTRSLLAMLELPSTKKSAPLINRTNPITNNK